MKSIYIRKFITKTIVPDFKVNKIQIPFDISTLHFIRLEPTHNSPQKEDR